MKQIILITDGCSNVGVSPVIAASHANAEGITVNVIGVVDAGEFGGLGAAEIEEIARAGGGMSRLVKPAEISQTVQAMTRRTVVETIRQVVGQELRQIVGDARLESLPPEQRSEVVRVMDDLTETAELRVVLLVDASSSMKPKLAAVKEAICDLQLSLQSRTGRSLLSVFHFPGNPGGDPDIEMDLGWTREVANLGRLFYKLNMRGTTPTGPALMKVMDYIVRGGEGMTPGEQTGSGRERPSVRTNQAAAGGGGLWSDYIV